ncbi:uncharacterized protein [Triticum aestivum]|uniref:uncharacterized protein n=1 Tax=Triticum aestivum TaxID=4565 RepID=UPI001D030A81|nr:uncharacterized protein LOC123066902 [Triticum aestivum]
MEPSFDMLEEQMLPNSTNVWVEWCGNGFTVTLPSNANIGALKRRVTEVQGLPIKRQKHTASVVTRRANKPDDVTNVELHDDYRLVSSLTKPPTTHLVGLNEVDDELYKRHYDEVNRQYTCTMTGINKKNYLTDYGNMKTETDCGKMKTETNSDKMKIETDSSNMKTDTDSSNMKTEWIRVNYTVGSMTIDCLVKKYEASHKSEILLSLQKMNTWRHPNVVALENMYERGPSCCLLVSSSFDQTFNGWLKQNQPLNQDGTFTPIFNKLMLELLDVVDKLVQRKIWPKSLTTQSLYVKMLNDEPQLKVLIDNGNFLCTLHYN